MIMEMVGDVLRKKNQFPAKDGISDKLSPLTIVHGNGPPDFNKMKFEFGAYGQAFQSNKITNTNTTRAVGAIALSMTPNKNGEYKFMSLSTGRLIHRKQFKVLPITDDVIKRVHELGRRDKQKAIDKGEISVEWRPGLPIEDGTTSDAMVPVYTQEGDEGNEITADSDNEYDDASLQNSADANDNIQQITQGEPTTEDADDNSIISEENDDASEQSNDEHTRDDASQ